MTMNPDFPRRSSGSSSLQAIRLLEGEQVVLVAPPQGAEEAFAPFELPRLPKSLADQTAFLGQRFWLEHQRCLGSILLLDRQTHVWSSAIPAQRCSHDAACWSINPQELADQAPGSLLAGSFQTRLLSWEEKLADAVPPVDGLHFVQVIHDQHMSIWSFLRASGKLQSVLAQRILRDDCLEILQACQSRLTLL